MIRGSQEPGLVDTLGRLASTVVRTVQSRIELASIELGEARRRLVSMLVVTLIVALLFGGAVAAASAWLAVSLWDRLGPAVLGWIALGYAVVACLLLLWLRGRLADEPALLAETLSELRQDASLLRSGSSKGAASDDRPTR